MFWAFWSSFLYVNLRFLVFFGLYQSIFFSYCINPVLVPEFCILYFPLVIHPFMSSLHQGFPVVWLFPVLFILFMCSVLISLVLFSFMSLSCVPRCHHSALTTLLCIYSCSLPFYLCLISCCLSLFSLCSCSRLCTCSHPFLACILQCRLLLVPGFQCLT